MPVFLLPIVTQNGNSVLIRVGSSKLFDRAIDQVFSVGDVGLFLEEEQKLSVLDAHRCSFDQMVAYPPVFMRQT